MHYMLVTSITLPLQAASNGRNYMHYMAHYMLSKMLMIAEMNDSKKERKTEIEFVLLPAIQSFNLISPCHCHGRFKINYKPAICFEL